MLKHNWKFLYSQYNNWRILQESEIRINMSSCPGIRVCLLKAKEKHIWSTEKHWKQNSFFHLFVELGINYFEFLAKYRGSTKHGCSRNMAKEM